MSGGFTIFTVEMPNNEILLLIFIHFFGFHTIGTRVGEWVGPCYLTPTRAFSFRSF